MRALLGQPVGTAELSVVQRGLDRAQRAVNGDAAVPAVTRLASRWRTRQPRCRSRWRYLRQKNCHSIWFRPVQVRTARERSEVRVRVPLLRCNRRFRQYRSDAGQCQRQHEERQAIHHRQSSPGGSHNRLHHCLRCVCSRLHCRHRLQTFCCAMHYNLLGWPWLGLSVGQGAGRASWHHYRCQKLARSVARHACVSLLPFFVSFSHVRGGPYCPSEQCRHRFHLH